MNVYSSIIYDTNSSDIFINSQSSINDVNCLIVHEDQSFDANNAFVTVADPMFVDPANGDYHIDVATSPAVDYCDDTLANAQGPDIDNQARGFDDPSVPNNPLTNGTFDVGADEASDLIFSNGFEALIPCRVSPMKHQNIKPELKDLNSLVNTGGTSCIL